MSWNFDGTITTGPSTSGLKLKIILPSLKNRPPVQQNESEGTSSWPASTTSEDITVAPTETQVTPKPATKARSKGSRANKDRPKGPPRPVKLRPLREVLQKLISSIKKKDSYAFFLEPVPVTSIPGYADVVKHPMDFGTMSIKVDTGKYRSLEEFTTDFRLVTNNAMAFNPPGTIHHSEATRIETWGLDAIAKAASTVIQYETDWNIDIEDDELVNVGTTTGTPVSTTELDRASPAVAFENNELTLGGGARGLFRKAAPINPPAVPEKDPLEAEGLLLPGTSYGVGIFPAQSDLAKTMVILKARDKKYKTKKERMKIERYGLPLCPDGSLDYWDIEEPFSMLSSLLPDEPSVPQLYAEPSQPPGSSLPTFQPRRRHWFVHRGAPSVIKREQELAETVEPPEPSLHSPRGNDFGIYPALNGWPTIAPHIVTPSNLSNTFTLPRSYEADEYLKEVVYGGESGYAYARSLQEFIAPASKTTVDTGGFDLHQYIEESILRPMTNGHHDIVKTSSSQPIETSGYKIEQDMQTLRGFYHPQSKINVSQLIQDPNELFLSDNVWAGRTDGDESQENIQMALDRAAELIGLLSVSTVKKEGETEMMDVDGEDPKMRELRLNLLGLSKRAPLNIIAPMSKELVPEHIRPYLPILL